MQFPIHAQCNAALLTQKTFRPCPFSPAQPAPLLQAQHQSWRPCLARCRGIWPRYGVRDGHVEMWSSVVIYWEGWVDLDLSGLLALPILLILTLRRLVENQLIVCRRDQPSPRARACWQWFARPLQNMLACVPADSSVISLTGVLGLVAVLLSLVESGLFLLLLELGLRLVALVTSVVQGGVDVSRHFEV